MTKFKFSQLQLGKNDIQFSLLSPLEFPVENPVVFSREEYEMFLRGNEVVMRG